MENTKRCPFCGETIKKEAKKCRHCGEWLTEKPLPKNSQPSQNDATQTEKEKEPSMAQSILVGCLFLLFFMEVLQELFLPLHILPYLPTQGWNAPL